MYYILSRSVVLILKCLNDGFLTCNFSLHKTLIDGLDYLWIIVMFYQLFGLSF